MILRYLGSYEVKTRFLVNGFNFTFDELKSLFLTIFEKEKVNIFL
jgi:hypothetical protein